MVDLEPEKKQDEDISIKIDRGFKFRHLLWFILGSAIAHASLFFLLARQNPVKVAEENQESKPIDFVVVSPEEKSEELPPEDNPNPVVESTPVPEPKPIPEPEIATQPTSEPEPAPETETETKPAPIPEPEIATQPTPESEPEPIPEPIPEPAPEPELAPKPSAEDLMSGSDPPEASSEPQQDESLATNLPVEKPVTEPSTSEAGSAADLLGGDYQKTLANSGDAFFSPEALSFESVLNPEQLKVLKDFDLKEYQQKLYDRVKANWRPRFYQDYSTWLTFSVLPNGQITELKIVESSGSSEFDHVAMDAVQNSTAPPLPPDFPLDSLPFKYQFYLY